MDFSNYRLTHSSEVLQYKELFANNSSLLNKWWLWLINRPPGSVFKIEIIPESHREMFIKLAGAFIMDHHPWISFNETFTELRCEEINYISKLFKTQNSKRLMENVHMNENTLIESPSGAYIRIGKVTDGRLNLITSFNPIERCIQPILKKVTGVQTITGMYVYPDGTGGLAITINEHFRPATFTEQLTELLTSIEEIHQLV